MVIIGSRSAYGATCGITHSSIGGIYIFCGDFALTGGQDTH
jgi:hypothetical protein